MLRIREDYAWPVEVTGPATGARVTLRACDAVPEGAEFVPIIRRDLNGLVQLPRPAEGEPALLSPGDEVPEGARVDNEYVLERPPVYDDEEDLL